VNVLVSSFFNEYDKEEEVEHLITIIIIIITTIKV